MKHLNDHSHDLKLSDPFYQDHEIICSVCEQELSSSAEAYVCTKTNCVFILHKPCFELPQKFEHKSHPDHSFTLLSQPPTSNAYICDACDRPIKAFGYQCEECNYKIHVKCALLPESVDCKAHDQHGNLDLSYSVNAKRKEDGSLIVLCGVCDDGGVKEGKWGYVCKECDFVAHVDCGTSSAKGVKGEEGRPCLFGLMSRCFCLPVS